MIRFLLSCLILAFCVGCISRGVTMDESDESLAQIKKAITNVIGDPRQLSQNQREFISQYVENPKAKQRHYYHITILGARRPYKVEIHAYVETKKGKVFEPTGEDSALAQKAADDLEARLNQSREDRNLIDDFRAF